MSSMNDGSHIMQFDAYVDRRLRRSTDGLDPSVGGRRVFYNIPPKDIIKVTPHSKHSNGWAEKEQGSQRHALPPWRSVAEEGIESASCGLRGVCTGD